MFDSIYDRSIESSSFESLKERLENTPIDEQTVKNGYLVTTAGQLAIEGKSDKVEWMRQLGASPNEIASGYAIAGNHEKVEFYRTKYHADPSAIAYGYVIANNHEKVEFYRTEYHAD
ncbi:MAG: hypothetical protein Q8R79_00640, partial [Legionellaceae bacterium]|nr:hypothetical protein [Legionellaceae bacterium]